MGGRGEQKREMLVKAGIRGARPLEESHGLNSKGWGRERRALCYCYAANHAHLGGLKHSFTTSQFLWGQESEAAYLDCSG